MTFRNGLLATTFVVATTGLAGAQDAQITGVVSLNGSAEYFSFRYDNAPWWDQGEGFDALTSFGGKVGVVVSPALSVQIDGWAQWDQAEGRGSAADGTDFPVEWNDFYVGGAAHLTYHAGDYLIGIVGGLGHLQSINDPDYASSYSTVGIEGGYHGGDFRIIGQAGLVRAIAGDDVGYYAAGLFASLTGTYYLTPDFSVSAYGTLTSHKYEGYPEDVNLRATLGADVRYKLDGSPLIVSLGYQAKLWAAEYATYENGTFGQANHRVTAGLHIPFGAGSSTLRDLDRTTGLSLEDPVYGIDGLR